jgi:hypothetical protein
MVVSNIACFNQSKRNVIQNANSILSFWQGLHHDLFIQWKEEVKHIPKELFCLSNEYYTTQFISCGFKAKPHKDSDINSYSIAFCVDRIDGIQGGDFVMVDYGLSISIKSGSVWLFNAKHTTHGTGNFNGDDQVSRNRFISVLTCPGSILVDYQRSNSLFVDCKDRVVKKK